jgi:hypothetical protein
LPVFVRKDAFSISCDLEGTWWTARIAIARKICSTRFYYCSTPFEQ